MSNLFVEEYHLNFLSGLGDSLGRLDKSIDRGVFAPELEASLARSDGSRGGRPPFDPLKMFKALIVQKHFSLSDEALEFCPKRAGKPSEDGRFRHGSRPSEALRGGICDFGR